MNAHGHYKSWRTALSKTIFLYNICSAHGCKHQSTKLDDLNSSFIILANSVTISGLTMKFRKNSPYSSLCIFSIFYFPIIFLNNTA